MSDFSRFSSVSGNPAPECFANHKNCSPGRQKSICELYVRCHKCCRTIARSDYHRGMHSCNETFCNNCKQKYLRTEDVHQCCIPPVNVSRVDREYCNQANIDWDEYHENKLRETKWKHVFFDIETDVVDDVHEPVLLIMQTETGEETVFYGKSCIDDFCTEVFSSKYHNTLFLSHGGRGYDNFFPLNYCYKHNIKPKILFNGGQILVLEIPEH